MRKIKLTKGQYALVDNEDYEYLSQYKWHANNNRTKKYFYADRFTKYDKNGSRNRIRMHRKIMNCPDELEVDHINGNTLDNRKINLRICSHSDNIKNQKSRGGKSKYRGVTKHYEKWRARITVNYKRISIGLFNTEKEAFIAYKKAHKEYYGRDMVYK